jgi:hypothetical protein
MVYDSEYKNFTGMQPIQWRWCDRNPDCQGNPRYSRSLTETSSSSDLPSVECGILLPAFRALAFGSAICFGESIELT